MVMRTTCIRCGITEFWNSELTDDEDALWFCPSCHQEMLKEKEKEREREEE